MTNPDIISIAEGGDIVADIESRLQTETNPAVRTTLELQLLVGRAFYPWLNARIDAHNAAPNDAELMAETMNAVCNTTSSMFSNAFRAHLSVNPGSVGMALQKFTEEFCGLLDLHVDVEEDDGGPEFVPEAPKPN